MIELGLVLIVALAVAGILMICVPYTPQKRLKRLEIPGAMIYPGSVITHARVRYRVVRSFSDHLWAEEL